MSFGPEVGKEKKGKEGVSVIGYLEVAGEDSWVRNRGSIKEDKARRKSTVLTSGRKGLEGRGITVLSQGTGSRKGGTGMEEGLPRGCTLVHSQSNLIGPRPVLDFDGPVERAGRGDMIPL